MIKMLYSRCSRVSFYSPCCFIMITNPYLQEAADRTGGRCHCCYNITSRSKTSQDSVRWLWCIIMKSQKNSTAKNKKVFKLTSVLSSVNQQVPLRETSVKRERKNLVFSKKIFCSFLHELQLYFLVTLVNRIRINYTDNFKCLHSYENIWKIQCECNVICKQATIENSKNIYSCDYFFSLKKLSFYALHWIIKALI